MTFPLPQQWKQGWLEPGFTSGAHKDCPTISYALPRQHSLCLLLSSFSQAHWDAQELSTLVGGGCTLLRVHQRYAERSSSWPEQGRQYCPCTQGSTEPPQSNANKCFGALTLNFHAISAALQAAIPELALTSGAVWADATAVKMLFSCPILFWFPWPMRQNSYGYSFTYAT